MIGMNFGSFILLLVISIIVALVLHSWLRYFVTPGPGGFIAKVVLGWIGGWLGSPVFGYWGPGLSSGHVYVIPAVLGSFALVVLAVDAVKAFQNAEEHALEEAEQVRSKPRPAAPRMEPSPATR
jgi:uncharacterized membrane protein YeaQ/YmgE (transglycosylase-associated protein family)